MLSQSRTKIAWTIESYTILVHYRVMIAFNLRAQLLFSAPRFPRSISHKCSQSSVHCTVVVHQAKGYQGMQRPGVAWCTATLHSAVH